MSAQERKAFGERRTGKKCKTQKDTSIRDKLDVRGARAASDGWGQNKKKNDRGRNFTYRKGKVGNWGVSSSAPIDVITTKGYSRESRRKRLEAL